MRKIYILLLFVLISILPLVFSLEIPFTLENDEYNYNFTSKIMTDNNGIEYKVATNGVIEINNERFLVFAIKGTIGETEIIKTSLDYNWTWHINQTGNDYIFWAENNDANLIWRQYFYFYEDPFREMKIENYVENNYSTSTDTTFYYIFNVLGSDNIEFNGTRYNLSDHIGFSKTGNLTRFSDNLNFNDNYDFIIDDLIDTGFDITEFHLASGSIIDHPEYNITAIGFTKNNGVFPYGSSVLIDPSFSAAETQSMKMAPLNSTAFVIAWCDETANDISFAVYATDGTVLRSVQDVDTSVSACAGSNNVVDVDSFNSTHIVIAYYDEADEDASYITGDWSTMNVTVQDSIGDSDTGAGTGSDVVSVAVLDNQTYVIGWLDDGASDERYRFEVRDIDGTQIGSDTTLSGSDVGGLFSRMGAAAFNSSHFVFAWKDYLASDITYKIYQVVGGAISNLTQEIDVDTTGSNTDSVDIATFNSTHFVILFADDPVHDVLFEIHDITGTRISGDDVSIDADDGGSGTIDVAAINSSAFVAVFGDDTASNSQVTIYDVNENQLLAPIAFEGTSETDMGIMSFKHPMGIELCDDNFIVASSTENWYANKTDGTTWNGICNSAGNAPVLNTSNNTNFSISTPNLKWNNATDGGYPIATLTYNLQIDNDSDFSSVTYENNTIIETVTPTNHTVNTLLDALYYWRVRSITSLSLNSSWSSTYIFRADTTGPTITITDPGDTEELISNVSINLNFTVADALLTVDTCWFNLWNSTDYEIGNTTITSCGNTTFNTSNSGTFNVTLYANDTLNNINLETNEFTITLSAPAITLSNPTDTEFLNSGTDVLFNFTASDSNGLGNCALYHNSTATFALNLSNSTSVVSGTPYNFTQNFTDSDYLWNIFCNDTLGNGRFSTNNRTFTVDSTDPNITNVSITTTQGSQTISFDVNVSDVNLDSCIYSIFNSSDAIDGLNDGVSVGCNSAGNAATVASFGTYNLQISASDLASNTNSTNTSFTTEDTSAPPAEGGGVTPPSVTQRIRLPSTNFSIVTTNFGDKMDFVLAKGSLRPREKDFILVNQDIEPIIIDLVCDTESLLANETTEEGSEINICDFVQFENETLSLTPNEIENTIGRVRITTPTDAKFGDQYNFNILALSNVSETEILFAKLSVTSRVPLWGKIFSWKKIPLSSQTAVSEVTGEEVPTRVFPLIFLALFVSFSLFVTVLVLTRKAFPLAGFALSVIFFVGSFTGIIIFL